MGPTDSSNDPLYDVVLRSIAAPTYFPSYQGYIDGGVFAHNPSFCALGLLMGPQFDIPKDKIMILSLGTGKVMRYLDKDAGDYDWGLIQWAPKIVDLLLDSMNSNTHQLCQHTLGNRYHRLDPSWSQEVPMDDPSLTSEIASFANEMDIEETIQWVREVFLKSYKRS